MTIQAHIAEGPFGDFLKVFVVDHTEHGKRLLHMGAKGHRWEDIVEGAAMINDPAPTFELPWDTGRALLESLVRHYQGAEDTRALRRDYDAERKRVDEQSKVIAEIARMLAQPLSL